MNYEKLYKEALNRAKHALNCDINGLVSTDKQLIFSMFPELKESKADRIRKELLDYLNEREVIERLTDTRVKKEWITWLEKQGEQKSALPKWKYKNDNTPLWRDSIILNKYGCVAKALSGALVSDVWVIDYDELAKLPKEEIEKQGKQKSDKVESKFKIEKGKWYVCTHDLLDSYANKAFCKGDTYLSTQDGSLIPSNSNIPFEVVCPDTYFRDWTIKDAKDGDVLAFYSNYRGAIMEQFGVVKQYIGQHGGCSTTFSIYVGVDWENNFQIGEYMGSPDIRPATKEQRDTLFAKMKEVGCVWDAEKKELKKIE